MNSQEVTGKENYKRGGDQPYQTSKHTLSLQIKEYGLKYFPQGRVMKYMGNAY